MSRLLEVEGLHAHYDKSHILHGVHLAIGVNEREDVRPGSLYNTLLVIGPGRSEQARRQEAG